ncbi:unnamed protein product [Adineta steineri]|uniref:BRO1 domain-containing protein n=1 Tax=Adineta steineri TaxID=433720 RepID=A0A813NAT3_9BILA|nr:unnamed protein product [Adineta steineri]
MEGCPRLPGLGFDLKLSIESVNLCEKIPNYINTHYEENGENFTNECEQMNRLRQTSISCSIDEVGVQILKRYYCQLQLLANRFPMLPDTECSVRFTWEDAFQREDNTYSDIRFEEACILYNIGAMYSKLGAHESRKSHESMKDACTYFRYSAACFEKLRDQYTPYSLDFSSDILTCQVDILLAQAHEAVLEKSLLDQRPLSVNAHIAMQISEYYKTALANLMKPGINSIVSKKFREWRVALTYKLSYYLAITYYCCGNIAEENKKRGEAVCYFENAVERLKDGWKNAEKISSDKTTIYKDAHAFAYDLIMEKYKSAKRDNDSVYFEKVPSLSSLPAIQGVIVAKSQAFDCHNPDVCGVDIFQKLIPMDIHLAASEYSEEKAKVLRKTVELTVNKNQELEAFMSCLQLDRIPLNNDYLRLPHELLDCCAAVAARSNMLKDLISAMQELNSHHCNVTEQITNIEPLLQTFELTNNSIKSNKEYQDLQNNVKNIHEMMLQANESNTELHRYMTTMMEHLKILNLPIEEIEKSLPTITEFNDENNKSKLSRINVLIEKIETMKKQREILLNDLRKKLDSDDITKLVLMRRQENHKTLFITQIKKHEELINTIKQNCTAQENILQSFTEANADIAELRTKITNTYEIRQRLIQEYINSFKSYNATLSKANEGIEFYKKQSTKLNSLNENLITLQSRQQQSKPLVNCQMPAQYSTSDSDKDLQTIPDRPRLKDYLAAMKPDTWGSTANRSTPRIEDNIYMPPPPPQPTAVSHMNSNNSYYNNTMPSSGNLYSNMNGQPYTSLPNFNSYQMQQPIRSELPQMHYAPPPQPSAPTIQQPSSFTYQQPMYNQSYSYDPNMNNQSQMSYNPSNTQSFPQQQFYPSQSQQPVYQPPLQHQLSQPTYHSGLQHPSMYQSQNFSNSNQQSVPHLPTKFDPYRPQPVGAYDIPNVQQNTIPSHLINPQDIYRPGGLLGINQTQISSLNNNNYDQNQFVRYIPSSSSTVSSSFANLTMN